MWNRSLLLFRDYSAVPPFRSLSAYSSLTQAKQALCTRKHRLSWSANWAVLFVGYILFFSQKNTALLRKSESIPLSSKLLEKSQNSVSFASRLIFQLGDFLFRIHNPTISGLSETTQFFSLKALILVMPCFSVACTVPKWAIFSLA